MISSFSIHPKQSQWSCRLSKRPNALLKSPVLECASCINKFPAGFPLRDETQGFQVSNNKIFSYPRRRNKKDWTEKKTEGDMKDVILITTCISVTDAYYYDIRNDFNCSEKCFFVSFFAAAPRAKCCKHFYSFIKTRSEARRWMERHFMMRENEKFSIYLNLFGIMIHKSV